MKDTQSTSPQLTYKVWLEIEECDTAADSYRNVAPGWRHAEFDMYCEARAFVESLDRLVASLVRLSQARPADTAEETDTSAKPVGT